MNKHKSDDRSLDIAWPTLVVFSVNIMITGLMWLLGSGVVTPILPFDYGENNTWTYSLLSTCYGLVVVIILAMCSYSQFTVAHDAVHRAISKKYKKLNDWIGWAAQLWLGPTSSWHAFKYNHLEHHAHTNDPFRDPDYWCSYKGPGGKLFTPLRWFFVDVSYFHFYYLKSASHRKLMTMMKAYACEIIKICVIVMLCKWGLFWNMMILWVIPSRIALFVLAFAFDFLPHYPHEITRENDRYKTTAYLCVPWIFRPILSILTFNQNYHLTHHLCADVPFFYYKRLWNDMKEEFLNEGIIVRDIIPKLIGDKIADVIDDKEYKRIHNQTKKE